MLQDAINEISGIINNYPAIYQIGIIDKELIELRWSDSKDHRKAFSNAIELLEFCENNLEQLNR